PRTRIALHLPPAGRTPAPFHEVLSDRRIRNPRQNSEPSLPPLLDYCCSRLKELSISRNSQFVRISRRASIWRSRFFPLICVSTFLLICTGSYSGKSVRKQTRSNSSVLLKSGG